MLTSSPKIFQINCRDFFKLNFLGSNRWIWSRCCDADFNSTWARLSCYLSKGPLKQDFLDIYLTTFSQSVIWETQKLWLSSFASKPSKFNLDFKNVPENSEKVFCLWDNCIWIGIVKLSLWRTRNFLYAANVVTSSPKICHVNKRDSFQLNFLGSDRWIWSRCCDADFSSSCERLPCCLSNCPIKREFLDIYLITFSQSVISQIKKLLLSSFYSKSSKFNINFQNAAKTSESFFSFSNNWISIAILKLSLLRKKYFWLAANVLTSRPKIWHVSIRETFSNSISFPVTNEYDKGAVIRISTVVGHVYHIACRSIVWNGTF